MIEIFYLPPGTEYHAAPFVIPPFLANESSPVMSHGLVVGLAILAWKKA